MTTIFAFDTDFESIDSLEPYLNSDIVLLAKSRLTSILSSKTKIQSLVQAMVSPLEDLRFAAQQLKNDRWIDTAIGAQLDGCGYIVGEKRLGRSDDVYREAIKFRIFINTSNATPEDLIKALTFITKPDDVQYIEQYPATTIMFTDGVSVDYNINDVIQDLSPVAISNVPILVSYGRPLPFRFGKESPPAEMFIDNDENYLTIDGSDWQLTSSEIVSGSRLGGVVASELFVEDNEFYIEIDGAIWALNTDNDAVLHESGYHLTGIFDV